MEDRIPRPWAPLLEEETKKPYFTALLHKVEAAYAAGEVYPPEKEIFAALSLTPPQQVRAVILGQDPYHEPGQAHGLAFSVREGVALPPSLQNIFKELRADMGVDHGGSGRLTGWAEQGVLLLNTVLTVERSRANSHKAFGWQRFTDAVLASLSSLPQPIVFVLWGAQAQKKAPLLSSKAPRCILSAPHPSPLSSYRGFFGSRPFSKINAFLEENGAAPVDWSR